jgi:uridine phosphorylase
MPIPNLPGKHRLTALFQPADYLRHVLQERSPDGQLMPQGAVLVYNAALLQQILDRHESTCHTMPGFMKWHDVQVSGGTVAVKGGFGIGGPAAATTMEEIIAAGVRRVISIGVAGGLHPAQGIGDLVLCSGAVRDEGVSYHYLAPDERYVYPDEALTARLHEAIQLRADGVVVGRTWTTDAPYRETLEEVLQYRAEGVLTVEMEAASLAAVALHRGVAFATAFAIADSLAEQTWRPEGLDHRDALTALNILFDAAASALVSRD